MSSANGQASRDRITDVLRSVHSKGVRLWSANGQLYYRAPRGVLTQEELESLRISRRKILALLELEKTGSETAEPELKRGPRLNRAPLAFSQLAHWHWYQLSTRRARRQIASATRVRGRLNIEALNKGLSEIVHRHEALRTRIVICDGSPVQEIDESGDCDLRVDDLSTLSEGLREVEVSRLIEELIMEPIDVAVDPLFAVRLLRLRDDEHVLIMAMEHIISDGFSRGILLRDLFTAYMQTLKGGTISLPPIPIQFADYAAWLRSAQRPWAETHGAYWHERLAGCQRLRFPEDRSVQNATSSGWDTVPIRIGRDLKAELREWCRLRRTTLIMGAFTAYVALVLRWCSASESVIQYESNSRVSPEIENTIGYFASVLYLRLGLLAGDSFVDLLSRVTEEYCRAYEHADFSFIAAQLPRPEFTRNTFFNWAPQGSRIDLSYLDGSEDAITCSPIHLGHPVLRKIELDNEPGILLYDAGDEIAGDVYFPVNRFSVDMMERFGRNFLMFIKSLLRQPELPVKGISLL